MSGSKFLFLCSDCKQLYPADHGHECPSAPVFRNQTPGDKPVTSKKCAECGCPIGEEANGRCWYCESKSASEFREKLRASLEAADSPDRAFESGAVRSKDADHLDFGSMPLIGLLAVAKNAGVGGEKYGRFNYMLGMPAHTCVNHAIRHLVMWLLGDRSEAHLPRAAWNAMVAEQSMALDPELNKAHLPGPGYTITDAIRELLASGADERAARRKAGDFKEMEAWQTTDLPEVQTVLSQRNGKNP